MSCVRFLFSVGVLICAGCLAVDLCIRIEGVLWIRAGTNAKASDRNIVLDCVEGGHEC